MVEHQADAGAAMLRVHGAPVRRERAVEEQMLDAHLVVEVFQVPQVGNGGGRVRVTSFSGTGEVAGMSRFGRNPSEIIAAVSLFFGRSTSFPLDLYASRYAGLPPADDAQRHVVVLSDDGLVSMFGVGNEPYSGVAKAVRPVLTTGTLVLMDPRHQVAQLAERNGYDVVYLRTMADAPGACAALAETLHG